MMTKIIEADETGLLFPTLKELKEFAKKNGIGLCSCYCNYPNPYFKKKKCDRCIPVSNEGFKKYLTKQYCIRARKGENK